MTELRHGYTLHDVRRIAGYAAKTAFGWSTSLEDRFQAAWDGVVEHLYEVDHWPSVDKLASAGRRSVARAAQAEQHHHGVRADRTHDGAGSMPAFQRFWCLTNKPYPSPDTYVVEQTALSQILRRLSPRQRQVLAALAAHGTHATAAAAIGMDPGNYGVTLSAARRRFLSLWHEGEEPSRIWRIDRRVNALGELSGRTSAAQLRSHRRVYQRAQHAVGAANLGEPS